MIPLFVLAAGLVAAVFIDLRSRRIPNWLTALMAVAGLVMAVGGMSGKPSPGITLSVSSSASLVW